MPIRGNDKRKISFKYIKHGVGQEDKENVKAGFCLHWTAFYYTFKKKQQKTHIKQHTLNCQNLLTRKWE